MIVHELRKLLGDTNWNAFIKKFYSSFKNNYTTYDDFVKALSIYDKDESITKSLNYYLNSTGFHEITKKE